MINLPHATAPPTTRERLHVYSLGATLYHALTGRRPFPGRTPMEILLRVREGFLEPIRRVDAKLPRELETIVTKAMEADRERRYATASALAEDLERFLANRPILARPQSAAYQFAKLVQRHKAPFALLGVVLAGLVGFGVTMAVLSDRIREQAGRIEAQANELRDERDRARVAEDLAESEADKARREARISARVSGFLEEILNSIDPQQRGSEVRVREVLDAASERIAAELAEVPEVQASVRRVIGVSYVRLGLLEEAEPHLAASVEVFRQRSAEDEHLAMSLQALGELYIAQGRVEDAEPFYRESCELRRKLFGEDSLEAGDGLRGLGYWHLSAGEHRRAEELFRESLAIRDRHGVGEVLSAARDVDYLGMAIASQEDFAGAEPLFRRAIEISVKGTGEGSLQVASARANLATLLYDWGKYAEADELYRRALPVLRAKLGPAHPTLAPALIHQAELFNRGLPAREDATSVAREAVDIFGKAFAGPHHDLALALLTLGKILESQGQLEEAESVLEEANDMMREVMPADHPDRAKTLMGLAILLRTRGDLDAATALLREAIEIERAALEPGRYDLGCSLCELASALLLQDDPAGALEAVSECLRIFRGFHPPGHWNILLAEVVQADCQIDLGRFEEAEAALLEGFAAVEARPDLPPGARDRLLTSLVALYDAWGKPEQAAEYRALVR